MSVDENQPPPQPLPPEPPETRMEASIRNAMEAIERLAAIQYKRLSWLLVEVPRVTHSPLSRLPEIQKTRW